MRPGGFLLLTLAGIAAGGAGQPDRPPLVPARDATIEYEVLGKPGRPPMPVRVRFSGGRIRAEPAGLPGYVIVDRDANRAMMVLGHEQIYFELPIDSGLARDYLPNERMTYARRGDARVAGMGCTNWEVATPEGRTASACVTADGLVLRGEGHDPRFGNGSIAAVSVRYEAQPATLFQPPAGFQRIALPSLPGLDGDRSGR